MCRTPKFSGASAQESLDSREPERAAASAEAVGSGLFLTMSPFALLDYLGFPLFYLPRR